MATTKTKPKTSTKTRARSRARKPPQARPYAPELGKKDQEEYVAHLIVQMQSYFEGLQAANRAPRTSKEPSEQVLQLMAAYDERHLKLAGTNFRKIDDIPRSLDRSLSALRQRIEDLVNFDWPHDRVLIPGRTESYQG